MVRILIVLLVLIVAVPCRGGHKGVTLEVEKLEEAHIKVAGEFCERLLEDRLEIDAMFARLVKLETTLGLQNRRRAKREASSLCRKLNSGLEKLMSDSGRLIKPLEKDLEKVKEKQGDLVERIDKLEQRGKKTDSYEARLSKIESEQGKLEAQLAMLRAVGMPSYKPDAIADAWLAKHLELGKEGTALLARLRKSSSDCLEYRLMVDDIAADLAALPADAKDGRTAKQRKMLENAAEEAKRRLARVYSRRTKPLERLLERARPEGKKLEQRAERAAGRSGEKKANRALFEHNEKIYSLEEQIALLRKLAEPALAEPEPKPERD